MVPFLIVDSLGWNLEFRLHKHLRRMWLKWDVYFIFMSMAFECVWFKAYGLHVSTWSMKEVEGSEVNQFLLHILCLFIWSTQSYQGIKAK